MFDPKNRIHWVAVILIAIILILILGVTSAAAQERTWPADSSFIGQNPCGAPAYVQRDTEPRLQDREALREHLVELQEDERPEAGGRVLLRVCVFETGHVGGITVHTSSGDLVLDSIALRVIADARYTPATHQGRPATVWIAEPVDFIPRVPTVEL